MAERLDERLEALDADPRYHDLVGRRSRFAWLLTALTSIVFFGYILLIAFDRQWLAKPVGEGATTIGIPIGLGVILFGIAITAVYVRVANQRFDPVLRELTGSDGE